MTPEALAQMFHEAYERLAPAYGYKTREASAKPWTEVPLNNKRLMIAVCNEILNALTPRPLRLVVDAFIDEVARTRAHIENRNKGGQHVPFHGDFASVLPSALSALERWVRAFQDAPAQPNDEAQRYRRALEQVLEWDELRRGVRTEVDWESKRVAHNLLDLLEIVVKPALGV